MNEQIELKTLPNGIRVVSERIPHVRSVALGVWIRAGSIDDEPKFAGTAHAVEHMLFKGTKNRTALEIAQFLEEKGGQINAFTGKEDTCYFSRVMDKDLPDAMELLSDQLHNPLFDKAIFEREKRVIFEEISNSLDNHDETAIDNCYDAVFPEHPLGREIAGTLESVAAIAPKTLFDFINVNYTPSRIVIAAAGNLEHEKIQELTEKYFNGDTISESKPEKTQKIAPQILSKISNDAKAQSHICLGKRIFPYQDSRRWTLNVLNGILSAGMSSRLFQNIREKYGYAYSVFSFYDLFVESGLFAIYAATNPDKSDKVIDLIKKEVVNLQSGTITDDELQKVKTMISAGTVLALESTTARMQRIGRQTIYHGKPLPIDESLARIDAVEIRDIEKLVEEVLLDSEWSKIIIQPEEKK